MTGYTVHTGSNENFASGWDQIFSGGKKPAKKRSGPNASEVTGSAKGATNDSGGKKPARKVKRGK